MLLSLTLCTILCLNEQPSKIALGTSLSINTACLSSWTSSKIVSSIITCSVPTTLLPPHPMKCMPFIDTYLDPLIANLPEGVTQVMDNVVVSLRLVCFVIDSLSTLLKESSTFSEWFPGNKDMEMSVSMSSSWSLPLHDKLKRVRQAELSTGGHGSFSEAVM